MVTEFLERRAIIEENYGRELMKLAKNTKEKYVYDLTVDNEVFLAGTAGMFVHNSYAVKLEILRYLMWGIDILVIDPENEYEFLANGVDGNFFKISLSSEYHVNPFDLPMPGCPGVYKQRNVQDHKQRQWPFLHLSQCYGMLSRDTWLQLMQMKLL